MQSEPHRGQRIQSLLFERDAWTLPRARAWLARNHYAPIGMNEDDPSTWRFDLQSPGEMKGMMVMRAVKGAAGVTMFIEKDHIGTAKEKLLDFDYYRGDGSVASYQRFARKVANAYRAGKVSADQLHLEWSKMVGKGDLATEADRKKWYAAAAIIEDAIHGSTKKAGKKRSKKVAKKAGKKRSKKVAKKAGKKRSKKVAKKAGKKRSKKVAKKAGKKRSKKVAKKAGKKRSKKVAKKAGKKRSKKFVHQ